MARNIAPDDEGFLYRAAVRYEFPSGYKYTGYFGPYTNKGTAKSQITRQTGRHGVVDGRVQRTEMKWEDVT